MPYSLFRERDNAGDSGPMSLRLWIADGELKQEQGRPEVGFAMRVGSFYGRSYEKYDWWQTTPVVQILEDTGDTVRFKTKSGSIYRWEQF